MKTELKLYVKNMKEIYKDDLTILIEVAKKN